jgi:hypothetical protein
VNALERGEHGTATTWRLGCHCAACRAGLRRQAQVWWARRVLRRGGEPQTHVPAGPVRRHIAELEAAGWSRRAIARAAQIAPATITRIAHGSTRRCSLVCAHAIRAIEP